jgi:hypothetical protein
MGAKISSGRHCAHSDKVRDASNITASTGGLRSSRAALLAGASLAALGGFAASDEAHAACNGPDQAIMAMKTATVVSNGGAITVTNTGILTGPVGMPGSDAVQVGPACSATTVSDSGKITGGAGANSALAKGGDGGAGVSNTKSTNIAKVINNATGEIKGGKGGDGVSGGDGGAGVSNSGMITMMLSNGGVVGGGDGGSGIFGTGGAGVSNAGTIKALTNSGTISGGNGEGNRGNPGNGGAGISNTGTITMLTNSNEIDGGRSGSGPGVAGAAPAMGGAGVSNDGKIMMLTNSGTINGANGKTGSGGVGVLNAGTITTLTNSGAINAGSRRGQAGILNNKTIGTLTNEATGVINGGTGLFGGITGGAGVSNASTITTLTNSGKVSGGAGGTSGKGGAGASNTGTIITFTNKANASIIGGPGGAGGTSANGGTGGAGVSNAGTIAALTNSGRITGGTGGVNNTGLAKGGPGGAAVSNAMGAFLILLNLPGGAITGGNGGPGGAGGGAGGSGVANKGFLLTLTNGGTITGGRNGLGTQQAAAVSNIGTIAALTNSGTIIGGDAIFSEGGGFSTIANTGSIVGDVDIQNQSVTVTGGSGNAFGRLTGGTINIENGDLTFGGGNTFLGDNIIVNGAAGAVTNTDPLMIAAPLTISGNFSQTSSGALDLDFAGLSPSEYGSLSMSGDATLDGELNADMIDGFQFMAGETFDILNFASLSGDFAGFAYDGNACTATSTDIWTCGSGPIVEELFPTGSLDLLILRGVPEPSTWVMMATGFLGLAGLGLRRRARARAA